MQQWHNIITFHRCFFSCLGWRRFWSRNIPVKHTPSTALNQANYRAILSSKSSSFQFLSFRSSAFGLKNGPCMSWVREPLRIWYARHKTRPAWILHHRTKPLYYFKFGWIFAGPKVRHQVARKAVTWRYVPKSGYSDITEKKLIILCSITAKFSGAKNSVNREKVKMKSRRQKSEMSISQMTKKLKWQKVKY